MAESPAQLIDKLCIIHLKYWHYQDEVQKCKREGKYKNFAEIQTKIDMCNQDRNELIAELDELLEKSIIENRICDKKFRLNRFHDHGKVELSTEGN